MEIIQLVMKCLFTFVLKYKLVCPSVLSTYTIMALQSRSLKKALSTLLKMRKAHWESPWPSSHPLGRFNPLRMLSRRCKADDHGCRSTDRKCLHFLFVYPECFFKYQKDLQASLYKLHCCVDKTNEANGDESDIFDIYLSITLEITAMQLIMGQNVFFHLANF